MAVDKEMEEAIKQWNSLFVTSSPLSLFDGKEKRVSGRQKLAQAQEDRVVTNEKIQNLLNKKLYDILKQLGDNISIAGINHLRERLYMLNTIQAIIKSS